MRHLPFAGFIIFILTGCGMQKTNCDLILHTGVIYTVDSSMTIAQAVAIKDGRIIAVGTDTDIRSSYASEKNVNLDGKTVYPGFIDPHCHFYGYGTTLRNADLTGTSSWDDVLQKITQHQKYTPSEWVLGRGWDQNDWKDKSYPTKERLDELFPKKPVMLTRIDGHAVIGNSVALKMAGINAESSIAGGEILELDGILTGVLIDNAADSLKRLVPDPSPAELANMLLRAQRNCFAVGLTSVGDAGLKKNVIDAIDSLHQSGDMNMRVYAMVEGETENFTHYLKTGPIKNDHLNVRSVKVYADGALGSRGALLLEPYSDDPTNTGLLLNTEEFLRGMYKVAFENGYQVCTHCIGDSAVRKVVSLYSEILTPKNDLRWRIEHAQVVHPEDQERMKGLSIVPSVQGTHATSDMYWAEQRLGPERVKYAYAYKDLLNVNGWIPNGSDFPIENINPLYGFYAAVARKDHKGFPDGGFQPKNALSKEEALKAMTIWAAKAQFEEAEKGSIEVGKFADMVVLDTDIMKCNIEQAWKAKVLTTYSGGSVMFD